MESSVAYEALRDACEQPDHPVRRAVAAAFAGAQLVGEVANLRPGETLAGQLDGAALVSLALAVAVLEHDASALDARRRAMLTPADELEIVVQNTDTNAIVSDPDPVQRALLAYLNGSPGATAQLAAAAYGRGASYGTKAELARTCAAFLAECGTLIRDTPAAITSKPATTGAAVSVAAAAAAAPVVAPEPTPVKPQLVDAATSPRTRYFYDAGARPFSVGTSSPVASPALSLASSVGGVEKNVFWLPDAKVGVGGGASSHAGVGGADDNTESDDDSGGSDSVDDMILRALNLSL